MTDDVHRIAHCLLRNNLVPTCAGINSIQSQSLAPLQPTNRSTLMRFGDRTRSFLIDPPTVSTATSNGPSSIKIQNPVGTSRPLRKERSSDTVETTDSNQDIPSSQQGITDDNGVTRVQLAHKVYEIIDDCIDYFEIKHRHGHKNRIKLEVEISHAGLQQTYGVMLYTKGSKLDG